MHVESYRGVIQDKAPDLLKISVLFLANTRFSKERQNKTKALHNDLAIYKRQLTEEKTILICCLVAPLCCPYQHGIMVLTPPAIINDPEP